MKKTIITAVAGGTWLGNNIAGRALLAFLGMPVKTSSLGRLSLAGITMLVALGALWLVAFSHQPMFHDAAHDVRHSLNFPCH